MNKNFVSQVSSGIITPLVVNPRSKTLMIYLSFHHFVLQQQEQDPTNLYLSNLPVSMDEQELENLLKPFGQVISTRILRDAQGVSRGVGFARSVRVCT